MKIKWKEQHLNVPDEGLESSATVNVPKHIERKTYISFVFFEHRAYSAENPLTQSLNKQKHACKLIFCIDFQTENWDSSAFYAVF